MSLRDRLQKTKEQIQAEKEAVALKQAEMQKKQKDEQEADGVVALRGKISDLESQKAKLENTLSELKKGYGSAGEALAGFKTEDIAISKLYEDFKEDLDKRGILSKKDLIQSSEGEEDVQKYRKAGGALREEVGKVRSAKEALKAEIPGLNFRGKTETKESRDRDALVKYELEKKYAQLKKEYKDGHEKHGDKWQSSEEIRVLDRKYRVFDQEFKAKGFTLKDGSVVYDKTTEKTPREQAIEQVEKHIQELGKQIEGLVDQTPERIEEKQKVAECLDQLKRDNGLPFIVTMDDRNPNINLIDERTLLPRNRNYFQDFDTTDRLSKRFGESALQTALLEGLSPEIDKIIENQRKESEKYNGRGSFTEEQADIERKKLEDVIRAKINLDIAKQKAKDFEEKNSVRYIKEEKDSNEKKKRTAENELPRVIKAKLDFQDRLGEEVETRDAYFSARFPETATPFEVRSLAKESPKLIELNKQLSEAKGNLLHAQKQYESKLKNPPKLFGKEEYKKELASLKKTVQDCEEKVVELQGQVEEQKKQDDVSSKNIVALADLIIESRLCDELKYQKMTIKELLEKIEAILKQNQHKDLTPEQKAVLEKYNEMQASVDVADTEYRKVRRN